MNNIMHSYYGFSAMPFSKQITVENILESASFKEASGMLSLGVNQEDVLLLTGDIGVGKSVVLRSFLHTIDPQRFVPVYVRGPHLAISEIYKTVLAGLHIHPPYSKTVAKLTFFKTIPELKKKPVIIIDDAQEMLDSTFTELKSLMNFELDSKNMVTLILSGQHELLHRLRMQHMASLCQRIKLWVTMHAFTCEETVRYIDHHTKLAGNPNQIFSEAAKAEIYKLSQGVPRKINVVCYNSLLKGAMEKRSVIDTADIILSSLHQD